MKYRLRIKGEHCFLNRRPFMFGELVATRPLDWFEVIDDYEEGEYLPINQLNIWLEEYCDDSEVPAKVVKLIDNGRVSGGVVLRHTQCHEELPMLYRYCVYECDGSAEISIGDHFESEKFEVRCRMIGCPGRGRIEMVSSLAYDGNIVRIVDLDLPAEGISELSWACRFGDNSFWINGDIPVSAILAGLGYEVKNIAFAENDGYFEVARDQSDRAAVYLCKDGALPDSDGLYPCYVRGFPDTVARLACDVYGDPNFAVAILRYNPASGEME